MEYEQDNFIPMVDQPVRQPKSVVRDLFIHDSRGISVQSIDALHQEFVDHFRGFRVGITYAGTAAKKIWEICRIRSIHDNLSRTAVYEAARFMNMSDHRLYLLELALRGIEFILPDEFLKTTFCSFPLFVIADDDQAYKQSGLALNTACQIYVLPVGRDDTSSPFRNLCGNRRPLWREILALLDMMGTIFDRHTLVFANLPGESEAAKWSGVFSRSSGETECSAQFREFASILTHADGFRSFIGKGQNACIDCLKQFVSTFRQNEFSRRLIVTIAQSPGTSADRKLALGTAYEATGRPERVIRSFPGMQLFNDDKQGTDEQFCEMHTLFTSMEAEL